MLKATFDFPETKAMNELIIRFHAFSGCDTTSAFRWRKRLSIASYIEKSWFPYDILTWYQIGDRK